MRNFLAMTLGLVCLIGVSGARAATLVPVAPVPGSTSMGALAINNNGTITGSYTTTPDFSDEHGFVGTPDGNYTTFDYGTGGTEPRGINNGGIITGLFQSIGCSLGAAPGPSACEGFERDKKGHFTTITKNGIPLVQIQNGINSSGQFVGYYCCELPPNPHFAGYYGANGVYLSDLALPFTTRHTRPHLANSGGDVAGNFVLLDGSVHGFLLSGGVVTVIDFPDPAAVATLLLGINDKGDMSGHWDDESGNNHAFLLSADLSTFTSINVPSETSTTAWGLNNAGEVVVTGATASYIYCSGNSNPHGLCKGKGNSALAITKTVRVSADSFRQYKCSEGCFSATAPKTVNWLALVVTAKPLTTAPQHRPRFKP